MTAPRQHPHIYIKADDFRTTEPYTPHGGGDGKKAGEPTKGRPAHAAALKTSLEQAASDAETRRSQASISVTGAQPGVYIEFEAVPGLELAVSSLEYTRQEDPHKHIEVVAVTERSLQTDEANVVQRATVFVPEDKISHFLNRLDKYGLTTPKRGRERRYENTFDRIAALRLATLEALWTDEPSAYPADDNQTIWWEVWLRRTDGKELERLLDYADQTGITLSERRLLFDDRIVILAHASAQQLSASLDVLNDLAEVQHAKETAGFFLGQSPEEQAEWVKEMLERLTPAPEEAPAVCILDTGVNRQQQRQAPTRFAVRFRRFVASFCSHSIRGKPKA